MKIIAPLTAILASSGRYTVPISVTRPASALTFLPEGAVRRATAEVSIGVMDDARRMSDVATEEATFRLPEGKEEEPLTYTATTPDAQGQPTHRREPAGSCEWKDGNGQSRRAYRVAG